MQLEMLRQRGSPESIARPYQAQWAVTLKGRIDRTALAEAWRRLWLRHGSVLHRMPEGSIDVVEPGGAPPVHVIEGMTQLEAGLGAAWKAGAGSEYGRAAMELTLLSGAEADTLVLTKHHVYADGGGTSVFIREVLAPALGVAAMPDVQKPAPEFDAYLDWLDREAADTSHERAWQERIAGADVGAGLDFLAPARGYGGAAEEPTHGFGETERVLDRSQTEAVRRTLDSLGVRPSTASHAVAGLLLASGAGSRQAVFGSVRGMRDIPVADAVHMMGNLIASVCVRIDARPEQTVGEMLRETRSHDRAARAHAGIPLHDLQRIVRTATGRPFEALVVHNDGTRLEEAERELAGQAAAVHVWQEPSSPLVIVVGFGRTVEIGIKWDRARISSARAERFADRFVQLLASLAGSPDRTVAELPIATGRDLAEALAAGDGGPALLTEGRLDACFRRSLARAPHAVAVDTLEASWTYAEVDRRARTLAHAIQAARTDPSRPIALCMGRDLAYPSAQLAAWYAGGHFVPIDPELPPDRIRMLVEESRAELVIGTAEDCASIVEPSAVRIDPALEGPMLDEALLAKGMPADLAYAFFTSGSTGRPKLAQVTHRGVANYLAAIRTHYGLPERVSTVAVTPVGFDPSIIEVHTALMTGGTVGMLPRGRNVDFDHIAHTVEAVGASLATFVPAVLERLLEHAVSEQGGAVRRRLQTLRAVASGGEALPARVPGLFHEVLGGAAVLHNAYGPTETAIGVTSAPIHPGDEPPYPIGHAVAGVRLRIVDGLGRTLPIGAFGELAVLGVQVGRGYASDPVRTADRFREVGDPDGPAYFTGDRCTMDERGIVRFHGRMDFQFKVRGVRIEAEEIERAMCEVAGVQSAVVWYRGDGGARKVIGYYRAVDDAADGLEQRLRAHLKQVLPAQVVPAALVAVEEWPLGVNGKIDRTRLVPPADFGAGDASWDLSSPPPAATLAEQLLRGRVAELFAEVLRAREVRMTSSFFELGGDSLGAVVLLDRIAGEFGVAPGIADFLRDPTPVAIAARLLQGGATVRVEPVVLVHPSAARETLHCLPGVGGLAAFTYRPIAAEVAPEFRCLGYQLPGAGDGEKPILSFRKIAKVLADRVAAQTPHGDIHLMGYSFGGHLAVEIACLLAARGRAVATLVVLDAAPPRWSDRTRMVVRHLMEVIGRDRSAGRLTRPEQLAGFRTVRGEDLGEVERRLRAVTRLSQVSLALHRPGRIPCMLDLVTSSGRDVGVAGFRERVLRGWKPYARHGLRIETSEAGHIALVRAAGVPTIAKVLRRSLAGRQVV